MTVSSYNPITGAYINCEGAPDRSVLSDPLTLFLIEERRRDPAAFRARYAQPEVSTRERLCACGRPLQGGGGTLCHHCLAVREHAKGNPRYICPRCGAMKMEIAHYCRPCALIVRYGT